MMTANNHTVFALGADIKSRFCIAKNNKITLSEDFGNISILDNFYKFRKSISRLKIKPHIVAFDMHPGYFSSGLADSLTVRKKTAVQHHHAHIASVLAKEQIKKAVIGVAFDGTGYGTDGNIWGGEFLIVERDKFQRPAHFKYLRMPGGEIAVKQPWRMAFSMVYDCLGDRILKQDLGFLRQLPKDYRNIIIKMIKHGINSPLTSSAGRLFDAVSSILDVCQEVNFEAEAAIKLEELASQSKDQDSYGFDILEEDGVWVIGYNKLIKGLLRDIKKGASKQDIAKRFHNSLADLIIIITEKMREKYNINEVVLSGGVFQNKILFNAAIKKIKERRFNLIYNQEVPFNDLSICLGQAYVAMHAI